MNIICVLGDDTDYIVNNLKKTYASIEIDNYYTTLLDCSTDLKDMPVRVDKILISEDALGNDRTAGLIAFQTLTQGQFFKAREIIFVMKPSSANIPYIEHLFGEYHNVSIKEQPVHNFHNLVYLLGGKDALEQKKVELEYSELVRKKIGSQQTITLMAGEEYANKSALVLDDYDQVASMLHKLEAQQSLIEMENREISVEAIDPKVEPMEEIDITPAQVEPEDGSRKLREPKTFVVSGERGSGKTTMSYALAKSYSVNNKVLLVDLCMYNMGLSGLIEQLKEDITVAYLHTLMVEDARDADNPTGKALTEKMMNPETAITALTLSTETQSIIHDEEVLASVVEILLAKLKKAYDIVIIDLPVAKYTQYSFIFNTCDYLMTTFYRNISSAISLGMFLAESGLRSEWYKTIFIPTDAYNEIKSIPLDEVSELKDYLKIMMREEVVTTQPIKLTGFDLGEELSLAINSVIDLLPSKIEVSNYFDQMETEAERFSNEIDEILSGLTNPFETEEVNAE